MVGCRAAGETTATASPDVPALEGTPDPAGGVRERPGATQLPEALAESRTVELLEGVCDLDLDLDALAPGWGHRLPQPTASSSVREPRPRAESGPRATGPVLARPRDGRRSPLVITVDHIGADAPSAPACHPCPER